MRLASLLVVLGAMVVVMGCGDTSNERAQLTLGPKPEAAPPLKGVVLEKLSAAPYVYLRIVSTMGETWAAVPATDVATGAQVTVVTQVTMDGFESKKLGRRFDKLVFGTLEGQEPVAGGPAGMPAGHCGMAMGGHAMGAAGVMTPTTPPAEEVVKVDPAPGADGRTIAAVWAERKALDGKPVAVRGKIAKFLPGIMDRNWVHLRDGTGSRATNDFDLTVTTTATAAVGQVVVVKGTVHADKDFGSGYRYDVIVEDATLE